MPVGARALAAFVFFASAAAFVAKPAAGEDTHKRVLILHSFGRDFGPYAEVASRFQETLGRLSPGTVEFFEASLESARFAQGPRNEAPLIGYLEALFSEERMDLLVSMGGPAAQFCLRHRERLFASTPFLAAGVEKRWVSEAARMGDAAAAPISLDLPAVIENILHVLPDTKEIYVVLGGSSLSRLWLSETQREFQRFSDRVRFTWTNEWSLEEIEKRVAALPPGSAIFFGELSIDAAGVPHPRQSALERLRSVASAPLFGLFESQLGRGIVGGPLVPLRTAGDEAAAAAKRILAGEAPEAIEVGAVGPSVLAYDFRELDRWKIPETQLPAAARIQFRPPSMWNVYRGPLLTGLAVVALQAALIGGLLVHRSRRRIAEEEARALARRLLTAHEDERRKLARELHDDLSQRLARLSIDAARVERSIPDSLAKESARTMRSDLSRLSEDVHALAYQLHPSVLDDLGLNEALKVECEQFSRRESIAARLTSFQAPSELAPEVAVCLLRIAQEALRNVARHSRARQVLVRVETVNGSLHMNVSDDGVGFAPGQGRVRSLGHASMRERARLVGGSLEVESAPGHGTTVDVSVPLKHASKEASP
jgi:signal transduction histidine kinase